MLGKFCVVWIAETTHRLRHGCITALPSGCGCELQSLAPIEALGGSPLTYLNDDRYSTMDNVDGKQARRTGQSSGLGELFECVHFIQQMRREDHADHDAVTG